MRPLTSPGTPGGRTEPAGTGPGAAVGRAAGGGGGAAGRDRRGSADDGDDAGASAGGGDELAGGETALGGAASPDRPSARLTTGVGPVSSGSPLTSGAGAHLPSTVTVRLPRLADSRGADSPTTAAATGESGDDDDRAGAASGWTKRGSSSDGSPGPMASPPDSPAPGPISGWSCSSSLAGTFAVAGPKGSFRCSSPATAGTVDVVSEPVDVDTSSASSSRSLEATTSSVGNDIAPTGAPRRSSWTSIRGRSRRPRPPHSHRDRHRHGVERAGRRPRHDGGTVFAGQSLRGRPTAADSGQCGSIGGCSCSAGVDDQATDVGDGEGGDHGEGDDHERQWGGLAVTTSRSSDGCR